MAENSQDNGFGNSFFGGVGSPQPKPRTKSYGMFGYVPDAFSEKTLKIGEGDPREAKKKAREEAAKRAQEEQEAEEAAKKKSEEDAIDGETEPKPEEPQVEETAKPHPVHEAVSQ